MVACPKGTKTARMKPKRLHDRKHLDYVAEKPCCCCGGFPVEVHHLLKADPKRGMGRKAGDNFVVPLCPFCHRMVHNHGNETLIFEQYGVDGPKLAAELWSESHE